MSIDLKAVSDFANTLTMVATLVIILVGGFRRAWVFGWLYQDMRAERDQWRELALRGTELAERAVGVSQIATPR